MFLRCLCLGVMAFGLPFSGSVAAAEEFTVKLVRPHKVGDEYKTEISFSHKSISTRITSFTGVLKGTIKVLAVNARTGGIGRLTCTVDQFTRDGVQVCPAGTVIEGQRAGRTAEFTINGRPADRNEISMLRPMLPLSDPNITVSDDNAGGAANLHPIGTPWPVNSAMTAKAMQQGGVPVSPDAVKGESRIVRVDMVNGIKAVVVQTKVTVNAIQPHASTGSLSVLGGNVTIDEEAVLPIDISLPQISYSSHTLMTETFSTGRGNLSVTIDNVMKHTDTPK